jgi:hypothetical protein
MVAVSRWDLRRVNDKSNNNTNNNNNNTIAITTLIINEITAVTIATTYLFTPGTNTSESGRWEKLVFCRKTISTVLGSDGSAPPLGMMKAI